MKNFKHPFCLSLLTVSLGLSAFIFTNHANAADSAAANNTISTKASLQQEAVVLNTLAQDKTIQAAVQTANQTKSNKPSKSDLEKLKSGLNSTPVAQRLLEAQKASQLKIVGMLVTDKNGNSLGQTMPAKILTHPMAAKFVSGQIKTPKITQKVKVAFNPSPVSRITVGILDASNNNQVVGTLTEWIDRGDK